MNSQPVVDVLIPAYNAGSTVVEALRSIQSQSLREIRIIVVDDGSTDGTLGLLKQAAWGDPRITVIEAENRGIEDALNTGLAACRSLFVARHDADDIAYPTRLATQLQWLSAQSEYVAVGCNALHIDATGALTGTRTQLAGEVTPDPRWIPSRDPYIVHPFLLARTAALKKVGGYRYAYRAQDTDLYWRLSEMGKLFNLPEILGEYRMHDRSVSGVSVVNGRIAAVNSQLSAISALRRRTGLRDIQFAISMEAYQHARSLRAMIDLASEELDNLERAYLAAAASAKLLELASYRPYELDAEDCAYIGQSIERHAKVLDKANWRDLRRMQRSLAVRLLRRGRLRDTTSVIPLMHFPRVFTDATVSGIRALARYTRRSPVREGALARE